MKYIQSDGSYINDDTVKVLPDGATALTDEQFKNRTGQSDKSTLDEKRKFVWENIKAKRDKVELSGVKINIDGVDKWIHSTTASRIQHLGLTMLGDNIPNGLQWKTMDGSFITMTKEIANQIFSAITAMDIAVFLNAEAHKAELFSSEDPYNYDYSTGWGESFK
jgi:hypothetical protein